MKVHFKKPTRRNVEYREPYQQYREELRQDFNNACGYCDDSDLRVDRICFHIDHFAPQKRFSHLKNTYKNLVYACRFCNIRKSYHWIGDNSDIHNDGTRGFVDPCSDEYDVHLGRDSSGRIIAKTELGQYIVDRLNLNLMRHQLLWNARRSRGLRDEVKLLIDRMEQLNLNSNVQYIQLLKSFFHLTTKIDEYELLAAN